MQTVKRKRGRPVGSLKNKTTAKIKAEKKEPIIEPKIEPIIEPIIDDQKNNSLNDYNKNFINSIKDEYNEKLDFTGPIEEKTENSFVIEKNENNTITDTTAPEQKTSFTNGKSLMLMLKTILPILSLISIKLLDKKNTVTINELKLDEDDKEALIDLCEAAALEIQGQLNPILALSITCISITAAKVIDHVKIIKSEPEKLNK